METKEKKVAHPVVEKIRKIMKDNDLTQATTAEYLGTTPSQFSKILSGEVQISIWQISNFATKLNLREIDIFTYPKIYEDISKEKEEPIKAVLQIELKKDKKDQVLKLVFGENNLEILNK